MPKKVITALPETISMPSDQFGRYGIVADHIKRLAKHKKQKHVTILDIGGYKGEIHRFFKESEASITVLDLYDSDAANYVKGSALDLPFSDKSFDYVVSFEVFEHIPRKDREQYIREATRVGKGCFILTAPFSGEKDEVLNSEKYVNSFWKSMHGQDHPWLYEHISYRTPQRSELESILDANNMPFTATGNNDLLLWNLMLSFNYLTTLYRGSGLNPEVQTFYNQNVDTLEAGSESYYRYIYTIGSDSKFIANQTKSGTTDGFVIRQKKIQLINEVFSAIAKDLKNNSKDRQKELKKLSTELENRIQLYDDLAERYGRIENELERLKKRSIKATVKRTARRLGIKQHR